MSVAFLVIYEGRPEDPDAFLQYYIEKHVPMVWAFPKIRRVEIERGVDGGDFFMITRLTFDTIEDLRAAIHSKERGRARADMKNFPTFEGKVRRQAVEIMDMSRKAS
ncbi:MAG: EthD family reductase [Deltaproteobacteria bacterium]|nr:MAG: EthD family reductase [Deltaproteobacteria bacterium]